MSFALRLSGPFASGRDGPSQSCAPRETPHLAVSDPNLTPRSELCLQICEPSASLQALSFSLNDTGETVATTETENGAATFDAGFEQLKEPNDADFVRELTSSHTAAVRGAVT
jgi:hypothetical protein